MTVRLPNAQLTLKGRSRAAVGTCIRVCETGWLLDCGVAVSSGRPKHVFATHVHLDHIVHAPAIVHLIPPDDGKKKSTKKRDQVTFHIPGETVEVFERFSQAAAAMDKHMSTRHKRREEGSAPGTSSAPVIAPEVPPYVAHGVVPGDEVRISGEWVCRVYRTSHVVPSVAYGFFSEKKKLKQEYVGRADIAQLASAGVIVSDVVRVPVFAYLGDTTIEALTSQPELLSFGTVITECTYLEGRLEDAGDRGHTCWPALRPLVESHPATTFVLTHISLKHSAGEIRDVFRGIPNVIPWVPVQS